MNIHTHTHTLTHTHIASTTHTHMNTHTHTYIHTHTHTYIHTYIHPHTYTHTHTSTYIHIHTRSPWTWANIGIDSMPLLSQQRPAAQTCLTECKPFNEQELQKGVRKGRLPGIVPDRIIHTLTHTHTNVYMYTHTQMFIYTHAHTHTDTHTQINLPITVFLMIITNPRRIKGTKHRLTILSKK